MLEQKLKLFSKDNIQTGLDVIGFIPGIGELADGANAAIYANGDYLNGGLSILSVVPDGGDIIAKSLRNNLRN